jgi:uncharacterized membrane protein
MTKLRVFGLLSLLACLPWLGGMFVLGAIVAPTVFHTIPAPGSADAMTLVFRRFDRVAMGASVIVLVCEVGLATVTRGVRDAVRSFACIMMSALAIFEGTLLSPKIEALHVAGAIRGLGDLGLELNRTHHQAELLAKTELAFGLLYVVLLVWTLTASARQGSGTGVATTSSPARPEGAEREELDLHPDGGGGKLRRKQA